MFGRAQGINFGGIPKLLAPEISLGGNFSYDINGQFYSTTTSVWIHKEIKSCQVQLSLHYLRLLNSNHFVGSSLQNTGYYHYVVDILPLQTNICSTIS